MTEPVRKSGTLTSFARCKSCRFWQVWAHPDLRASNPNWRSLVPRTKRHACVLRHHTAKDPVTEEERIIPSYDERDPPSKYYGIRTDPSFACSNYMKKPAPYKRPPVLDLDLGSQQLMTFQQARARLQHEQQPESVNEKVDAPPDVS